MTIKNLLELISQLKKAVHQNATLKDLEHDCDLLTQYAQNHLDSEERAMRGMGYPDFESHKSKHDNFREWLARQNKQRVNAPQPSNKTLDIEFLENWWRSHILKEDMVYKEFMVERKLELDKYLDRQRVS